MKSMHLDCPLMVEVIYFSVTESKRFECVGLINGLNVINMKKR